jgi:putative hydrolases of HD superfamily
MTIQNTSYTKLLDDLINQITQYSNVLRKSTNYFNLQRLKKTFPEKNFDFDDELIRESLIEHVGCLPIIATFLHPYLDVEVDLGKVLTILAIHDIGETELGDELTFTKQKQSEDSEYLKGISILHPNYHKLYKEEFDCHTLEARFAKSVDKIAPDLLDLICGEEWSSDRLVKQAGWQKDQVLQKIRDKKRPFMVWSEFMTDFHDERFSRFETRTNI